MAERSLQMFFGLKKTHTPLHHSWARAPYNAKDRHAAELAKLPDTDDEDDGKDDASARKAGSIVPLILPKKRKHTYVDDEDDIEDYEAPQFAPPPTISRSLKAPTVSPLTSPPKSPPHSEQGDDSPVREDTAVNSHSQEDIDNMVLFSELEEVREVRDNQKGRQKGVTTKKYNRMFENLVRKGLVTQNQSGTPRLGTTAKKTLKL
ncbi:hypothetical protein ACMFMG_006432 [Clarireedia jacksonii]